MNEKNKKRIRKNNDVHDTVPCYRTVQCLLFLLSRASNWSEISCFSRAITTITLVVMSNNGTTGDISPKLKPSCLELSSMSGCNLTNCECSF